MGLELKKNMAIHISDRSHLNITINILSCGNYDVVPGDKIQIQKNDYFTIYYINEGTGLLEMNHSSVKVSASKGFATYPHEKQYLRNIGNDILNVTWVSFSGYLIESYLKRANILATRPLFLDENDYIGEQINKLYNASLKLPNRYCKMAACLYNIFAFLLDKNPSKSFEDSDNNMESFVLKAIDYIDKNYVDSISVEEIAEKLGISRKYLNKVFNMVLNMSPKKYIISVRMEKAFTALRGSNQPIAELAESIGYSNQFYFAKEFKRLTNMTPSQYRNSNENVEIDEFNSLVPILKEKFAQKQKEC